MAENLGTVRAVLQDTRDELLAKPNVVAAGIGYKTVLEKQDPTLSIVCSVTHKVRSELLSPRERVPPAIAGIPIDVVTTGPIHAFQTRTGRYRPAPGGVSIGHRDITAGTLGCLVRTNNQTFILSNNHVLANSNDASVGDPILQPGSFDGAGWPADHIAQLTEFVPIHFLGEPSDCSFAGAITAFLNLIAGTIGSDTRLTAPHRPLTDQIREW